MHAEEVEIFRGMQRCQPVLSTLLPNALAIIRRLTNCATSFLCTTTDNTGRQDGKAKTHQQEGCVCVCSSPCAASLLEV